ncbi:MAG: hypothetical protein JXL84_25160 [Deltaproteobacteria bacterium]|nr:hypothetical protein [Deltaproteobacteria bacterium]
MARREALVANLDLCMGCLACEVACKQEHRLAEGEKWMRVITLGPVEIDGELAMDFLPSPTERCDLCEARRAEGKRAFCAEVCPTRALSVQQETELSKMLRIDGRFHICKMAK